VTERRRRIGQILVEEAGGRCVVCGYAQSVAALQFHHLDPMTKAFSIRYAGTRALDRIRAEAAKCVLLVRELPCGGRVRERAGSRTITGARPSGVAQRSDPG
jgi:hypothetical protein